MSSFATSDTKRALSESQQSALVKLLADDDAAIYQQIRAQILSYGPQSCEWLRPHCFSSDPVIRRRVKAIVNYFSRQDSDNSFLAFCLNQGEDLDLEAGVWSLAKTEFPEISCPGYQAILDGYAAALLEQIDFGDSPERMLATINQYLFTEIGFAGNEQDYYDPDNSYFNRVIDRRTGNPVSLCLVYLFVGRRLGLPIAGIGMPGHFLVRFQSSAGDLFLDAFNRGKLLSKADCVKYLIHTSHGFQESFLAPITPRRTLLRICSNLHQIYSQRDATEQVARFLRYIVALAK